MDRGAIISGAGHLGLILWVILGDWLFAPSDMPPVEVAQVSLMSAAEYDAMVASAPKAVDVAPEPAAEPLAEPAPDVPAAEPPAAEALAEPLPDTLPVDAAPQPIEAPEPTAPVADAPQPIPVPNMDQAPAPRPIDRVADVPVDQPTDAPEIADTPTPEVSDTAAPDAPVIETPEPEAAPQEATTQIITEAVDTQDNAPQLAPTSSRRPQSRPEKVAEIPPEDPDPANTTPETNDAEAEAIAAALAEATAETPAEDSGASDAPTGPPMTSGDIDAMRVAVKQCWNLGSLSSDALRTTVTVQVSIGQDGIPDIGSIRMSRYDGGSDASAKTMFAAARSAIARCGKKGFPLPPETYDQWRDLELVFDPNGMRLR